MVIATPTPMRLTVDYFIQSFIHSINHSFIHSIIQSFNHSFNHSITQSIMVMCRYFVPWLRGQDSLRGGEDDVGGHSKDVCENHWNRGGLGRIDWELVEREGD